MNKKILYLHGFASSGASGTVELLRKAFWHPERGEEVTIATAPRTFSKLRLVAALDAQGLWSAVRDWMVEEEYYDLFLAAQDFREDHPSFTEILNAAKTRFGLSDNQTAALLDASVADS